MTEDNGIRTLIVQEVPISRESNRNVIFSRFAIPSKACKDEFGEMTRYAMNGKLAEKYDYVKGGSSVAAYIADLMCID